MVTKYILLIVILISFTVGTASAIEPIMITFSGDMDKLIFDGKWTGKEWKRSSLNDIDYNNTVSIKLRSAHQGDFIYLLVDFVSDVHPDKGADRAVVCFDGNNNKEVTADLDDYCFVATLGRNSGSTLQGGSPLLFTSHFKNIRNSDDFIAIGNISDENDRYSTIPHSSYEFRIPTDLIGRSDSYGFYLGVYDAYYNKLYTWPENIEDNPLKIPTPSRWGDLISPDKSLPEFNWPILVLLPSFLFIILLTRRIKFRITR